MLLEYSTSALIGTALRSYIKHSKAEESYRLSVNSSEKIAKAETLHGRFRKPAAKNWLLQNL